MPGVRSKSAGVEETAWSRRCARRRLDLRRGGSARRRDEARRGL